MFYHSEFMTTANLITFFRMLCTIVFIVSMITDYKLLGLLFFFIAGISDFFDGYIARLKNEETALGAVLDPIADKFLLVSAVILLFFQQSIVLIPLWFLVLIVIKESIQIVGGMFLWYHAGAQAMLRPTLLSKCSTALLLIYITFLLISHFYATHFNAISHTFLFFLLILNTILLCGSFIYYILLFLRKFHI